MSDSLILQLFHKLYNCFIIISINMINIQLFLFFSFHKFLFTLSKLLFCLFEKLFLYMYVHVCTYIHMFQHVNIKMKKQSIILLVMRMFNNYHTRHGYYRSAHRFKSNS